MHAEQRLRRQMVFVGVAVEGGLGLVACLLSWLTGQPVWQRFHWNVEDAGLGVAVCLPMLLAFGLCLVWPVGPLARIRRICEEVIRPLFTFCSMLDLAIISLLAGFGEEMLFRGWLQEFLGARSTPWLGLVLASLAFGLLHPITLTYVIVATGLGAYLGLVWALNGNLLTVGIAHGLYDFLVLVYLLRKPDRPAADSPVAISIQPISIMEAVEGSPLANK